MNKISLLFSLNNISYDHFNLKNKSKLNIKIREKEKNTLYI